MDDNFGLISRKIITLLEGEVEVILCGQHNEFIQEECNNRSTDEYTLIFRNKQDEYFRVNFCDNSLQGLYYQQSYAEQVFPKERKVTIIIYE